MISVIISNENIKNNIIEILDTNDINHLKNSFRLKIDEKIRAVDGKFEYICEIISIDKKKIELKILEKKEDNYSKSVYIEAAIGLLKNDKMDLVIQKLTEIGVAKITPLILKRGVAKFTEKKEKWDLIIKEATKQCQAVKLTEISKPKKISEINFEEYQLAIVPYENETENSIKKVLRKNCEPIPKKIIYFIGVEGGFEEEEILFLKNNNVIPVSLGKRILRAETASIVVGGVLVNEFE